MKKRIKEKIEGVKEVYISGISEVEIRMYGKE